MKWKPATFLIATAEGPFEVKGWSNGTFGVDKRGSAFYCVTHLITGMRVFSIRSPQPTKAKNAADALVALNAWDFETTDGWRNLDPELAHKVWLIGMKYGAFRAGTASVDAETIQQLQRMREEEGGYA